MKSTLIVLNIILILAVCALGVNNFRTERELRNRDIELETKIDTALASIASLEDWVANSSIQGKLNNYKRTLEDYKQKLINGAKNLKSAASKGLETVEKELQKEN